MQNFMATFESGHDLVPFALDVGAVGVKGGFEPGFDKNLFTGGDVAGQTEPDADRDDGDVDNDAHMASGEEDNATVGARMAHREYERIEEARVGGRVGSHLRYTVGGELMTANLELWLVRHGETTRSVAREIAGWSDPPLTDHGRSQASALRSKLEGRVFDGVWCSDLERARTTAALAWGEASPDPRLREFNFGELEELPFEKIDPGLAAKAMRFRDFQAPGGEDIASFRQRLDAFVDGLSPGRHLLFVHGGVIRSLMQDLGLDRFVATGSVVGVDWSGQSLLFVDEPEDAEPVFEE